MHSRNRILAQCINNLIFAVLVQRIISVSYNYEMKEKAVAGFALQRLFCRGKSVENEKNLFIASMVPCNFFLMGMPVEKCLRYGKSKNHAKDNGQSNF